MQIDKDKNKTEIKLIYKKQFQNIKADLETFKKVEKHNKNSYKIYTHLLLFKLYNAMVKRKSQK